MGDLVEAAVLFLHVREPGVVVGVDVGQVHLTETKGREKDSIRTGEKRKGGAVVEDKTESRDVPSRGSR